MLARWGSVVAAWWQSFRDQRASLRRDRPVSDLGYPGVGAADGWGIAPSPTSLFRTSVLPCRGCPSQRAMLLPAVDSTDRPFLREATGRFKRESSGLVPDGHALVARLLGLNYPEHHFRQERLDKDVKHA
jgi:hypothetical protein